MPRLFLFAALILTATTLTAGKVYRWVDENGVTQYTQTPPPHGEAKEIKPPPPPAVDPEKAQAALDKKRQQFEDRREDRQVKKQETQKENEKEELYAKNCQAARNNLKKFQASSRAKWKQEDGTYKRHSAEEMQQKISEAQKQIKEFCK